MKQFYIDRDPCFAEAFGQKIQGKVYRLSRIQADSSACDLEEISKEEVRTLNNNEQVLMSDVAAQYF